MPLTITGIEGDSIDCNRHDPSTLVTDVYVGSRDEFVSYEVISDRLKDSPPTKDLNFVVAREGPKDRCVQADLENLRAAARELHDAVWILAEELER